MTMPYKPTRVAKRSARVLAALAALAMAVLSLAFVQPAQAGLMQWDETFEGGGGRGWWTAGGAGFDLGLGYAHQGRGNGWVRNTTGWNAINTWVSVVPNAECRASAWIRLSPQMTAGYMTAKSHYGTTINEIRLVGPGPYNPAHKNYNQYVFDFNPGNASSVLFYVGMWGNGRDAWAQIDDVVIQCLT